jgi:hypothetical protein
LSVPTGTLTFTTNAESPHTWAEHCLRHMPAIPSSTARRIATPAELIFQSVNLSGMMEKLLARNMELNPNHPVVRKAHDHWHKIAAMIMVKLDLKELQISMDDLKKISAGNINIVLDARNESQTGCLTVRIVDDKTAAELARKEGGRACDS